MADPRPDRPSRSSAPTVATARRTVAEWGSWVALTAGAVLCVLGWYGVSGESVAERQLPYLASATVPGAALIVAGAVLLAHEPSGRTEARVEELYRQLTEEEVAQGPAAPSSDRLVALPGGTMVHRADCPLVAGREDGAEVSRGQGELSPCPVCEPGR